LEEEKESPIQFFPQEKIIQLKGELICWLILSLRGKKSAGQFFPQEIF
jgi:hypothetical protein